MKKNMEGTTRKAIIVGASSGIGHEMAKILIGDGWTTALAARRKDMMDDLKALAPERVTTAYLDVTSQEATATLDKLIEENGGMTLYLHVAGTGKRNNSLESKAENDTVAVNAAGFCHMVCHAYNYFASNGGGHIAVVSSIAGTMGLGAAPAYSATKAMQATYIEALAQQAHMRKLDITFSDIRPGFVKTALLANDSYPMTMDVESTARKAVAAIYSHRNVAVIDWRWSVVTALWRLIPHCIWRRLRIGG